MIVRGFDFLVIVVLLKSRWTQSTENTEMDL